MFNRNKTKNKIMTFRNIITIFVFVLNIVEVQQECVKGKIWPPSSPCKQKSTKKSVKVICKGLKSPEPLNLLPWKLRELIIQNSTFEILDGSLFRNCSHLKKLKLNDNSLTTFKVDLSYNLSIENLIIINNKNLNLSRSKDLFSYLGKYLHKLTILNSMYIPQEMFEPLTRLQSLELDKYATNGKLGKSFSKLRFLKKLYLKNFVSDLREDTFQYVSRCTSLTLSWANVRTIHNNTFSPLQNLKRLDLSYNMKMNLDSILPSLHAVSQKLEFLSFRYLIGDSMPTNIVGDTFFKVFSSKPNLNKLMLNKNQILHMRWSLKYTPRKLKYFDISYNRLSNLFYLISELFFLTSLEEVNMNFQSKRFSVDHYYDYVDDDDEYTYLSDDAKDDDLQEEECNEISMNDDSDDFETFIDDNCKSIDTMTCTFPTNIDVGNMNPNNWCIPCPRQLKILRADGSMNIYTNNLPVVLILGNCFIEEIRMRYNGFINAGGQMMVDRPRAKKPMLIDFSFNTMSCLSPDIFKYSISRNATIGTLLLEGNSLSEQLWKDKDGKTFERYEYLTELSLADNKIKRLPKDIFKNLVMLESLNLSYNSLQVLQFDVTKLTKLRILDLCKNLFVALDSYQQAVFSQISKNRGFMNFTVGFYGNPIQCSCETIGFIKWLVSKDTRIKKFERLTCLYYDKFAYLNQSKSIRTQLMLFCYASLPLKVVGSLLALTMICSLIGYVAYKHRWDIRYYILKRAQSKGRNLSMQSKWHDYYYDAFVCYDKKDRAWVRQELIENLENPVLNSNCSEESNESQSLLVTDGSDATGSNMDTKTTRRRLINNDRTSESSNVSDLRLCVHERDFEPGREIETNILSAIENSRRVILVISKNFLKSRWCSLELEMAKMESLVRGVNLIVAVFLEPIEDVTRSLDWLTKYYTYLEWFHYDDYRRHEFWRRLRVSLGTRKKRHDLNLLIATRGTNCHD